MSTMVSDYKSFDVCRGRALGGLSVFMYFFTVSLCMPSSRAIPRMDSPLRFAFCTAFHLAVCRGVDFLRRGVAALRTLLVPVPRQPILPVASIDFADLTPSLTVEDVLHQYDNSVIDATTIFVGLTRSPPVDSVPH